MDSVPTFKMKYSCFYNSLFDVIKLALKIEAQLNKKGNNNLIPSLAPLQ